MTIELIALISGAALVTGGVAVRYFLFRSKGQSTEGPSPVGERRDRGSVIPTLPSVATTPSIDTAATAPALEIVPEPTKPSLPSALKKTREGFWGRIQKSLLGSSGINADTKEIIEEILYTSDLGPTTVARLLDAIDEKLSTSEKQSLGQVKEALKSEMLSILSSVDRTGVSPLSNFSEKSKPQVWMIVGVNGAGKTTTIGKLAHAAAKSGLKVLVVAGDTFRAAASSQLKTWSDRAQVDIFSPEGVKDPGAVAFDAVQMAKARGFDLVIIDTAGRLHTQDNLMEELRKVKRVIQKLDPEAPHETLIVLDANSGQNALVQAQKFNETLRLSGAVFTKMDGTARGGVVIGLASQLSLPTVLLGVGESLDSLQDFAPSEYVQALFD